MNNDEDYLFYNCEDNARFKYMNGDTQERIEQYEAAFDENMKNVELIVEAFSEASDHVILFIATLPPNNSYFVRNVIEKHIHKATECQLRINQNGDEL